MLFLRALVLTISLPLASGCAGRLNEPPPIKTDDGLAYWPTDTGWRSARPQDVGMDRTRIEALVAGIRRGDVRSLHSLVVVRHGYLVTEQYFNGSSRADIHTLQSVSKSVTSLLVGIALDQQKLGSVDESFLAQFPEYTDLQNVDDRKRAMTIRQVLTMTSGLDFFEQPYPGSPLEQLNQSRNDWLRLILDRPMNDAPGGHWQYNSGAVIALGGMLFNRTALAADEFARRNLFEPIGISTFRWFKGSPNGLPHMGGGLDLRAVDLARIGYLVLRHGRWNDRQVVSEQWLAQSTLRAVTPMQFFPRQADYGYLWWLFPLNGQIGSSSGHAYVITGSGAMGQWLFIEPRSDLVVVVTAGASSGNDAARPLSLFFDEILAAVSN
jgi:CubicO group peptidase (beta-lactamase class C family)